MEAMETLALICLDRRVANAPAEAVGKFRFWLEFSA
jgi:hypothetical protein